MADSLTHFDMASRLVRDPHPTEYDYFVKNPKVGGMATEDGRIILNRDSHLKPDERQAVMMNEFYRLMMRKPQYKPKLSATDEQLQRFSGYGAPDDVLHTIIARRLSGDPSAGAMTPEQEQFADWLRNNITAE